MTRLPYRGPAGLPTMIAGYLVWSSCFVLLYALLSVGCELRLQLQPVAGGVNALSLVLGLVWALHLLALAWLIQDAWRAGRDAAREAHAGRFLRRVTVMLHLTALAATLWVGFPLLVLPPCS